VKLDTSDASLKRDGADLLKQHFITLGDAISGTEFNVETIKQPEHVAIKPDALFDGAFFHRLRDHQ